MPRGLCICVGEKGRPTGTVRFGRPKTTEEEREERKEQLRVLLSASKEDIDKLVRRNPDILKCSDIKNYGPKLKVLQERLGISRKTAGQLCVKANRLLKTSLATMENRMDWLQTRLNLNKSQLKTVVERDPGVLIISIENNLEPSIENIQSVLELSDEELTKLVVRSPDVLRKNMSAENIRQRLSLLQKLLGLPDGDTKGLRKYIIAAPPLLFWSEESMKENQQWIQQRFGLGDAKVAQMCRNRLALLYSKNSTLEKKVDLIQSDLFLSEEELSGLVSKFPPILHGYSPEKMRTKLQYLRMRFDLDDDALKNLLLKAPSLFTVSEGNIEEKFQFYSKLVGRKDAKDMVVEKPYLLVNYSLESRLKPRLEEVEKSGAKVRWNETLIKRLARRENDVWQRYKLGEAKREPRND